MFPLLLTLYPENCRRPIPIQAASSAFAEPPLAGFSASDGRLTFQLGAIRLGAIQLGAIQLGAIRLGAIRLGLPGWQLPALLPALQMNVIGK